MGPCRVTLSPPQTWMAPFGSVSLALLHARLCPHWSLPSVYKHVQGLGGYIFDWPLFLVTSLLSFLVRFLHVTSSRCSPDLDALPPWPRFFLVPGHFDFSPLSLLWPLSGQTFLQSSPPPPAPSASPFVLRWPLPPWPAFVLLRQPLWFLHVFFLFPHACSPQCRGLVSLRE